MFFKKLDIEYSITLQGFMIRKKMKQKGGKEN